MLSVVLTASAASSRPRDPSALEPAVAEGAGRTPAYEEVPGQGFERVDGGLGAWVDPFALRPERGYTPARVILRNLNSFPRTVHVEFIPDGKGGERVSTDVTVGAYQRVVTWLLIPVNLRYGKIHLSWPGSSSGPMPFTAKEPLDGATVLALGDEHGFQSGTGLGRTDERPQLSVRFVPPEDAPWELAAYVGHTLVVIARQAPSISEGVWRALEAHAATGGRLVWLSPPSDAGKRLPLLRDVSPGAHTYGFGQVRLCGQPADCGLGLLEDASKAEPSKGSLPVEPAPLSPPWAEGEHFLAEGWVALPVDAHASAREFLVPATLFFLVVGPGCWLLTRRRGPMSWLVAVPLVSLLACLGFFIRVVGVEGFSLRSSRYSLTWLDTPRSRAITVGVAGYFTDLGLQAFQEPVLAALLSADSPSSWGETHGIRIVHRADGMAVAGGFLPPRRYHEWGEVAVTPTRARLLVRREGDALKVINALGAPVMDGLVRFEDRMWKIPALAQDAEVRVSESSPVEPDMFMSLPEPARRRFMDPAWSRFTQPLPEGGFLVKTGGPGWMPTSSLRMDLFEAMHWIRGQAEGP